LDGAYKIHHIRQSTIYAKPDVSQLNGTIQNFAYMPAAQWVVEQYAYGDGVTNLISIYNREYPGVKIDNVQLYKTDKGDGLIIPSFADTLTITQISKATYPDAYTNTYLGYYKEKDPKYYKLDYLSGIKLGNFLKVLDSATDSLIYVDVNGQSVFFELEEAPAPDTYDSKPEGYFGYDGTLANKQSVNYLFEHLRRTTYNVRIKAPYLLFADGKYIVKVPGASTPTGEDLYAISSAEDIRVPFFLKENNRLALADDKAPFYALVEAHVGTTTDTLWYEGQDISGNPYNNRRAGVKDGSLLLSQEAQIETRVAAFALRESDVYLYRRFDKGTYGPLTEPYGDEANSPLYLKFFKYNNYKNEFLSENSKNNTIAKNYRDSINNKDISFLGLYNISQIPEAAKLSYTFYVDTAYVRNKTVMPQYMLALRPDIVTEDLIIHETDGQWKDKDGNIIDVDNPTSDTIRIPALVKADYLFNAQDSVTAGNKDYEGKFTYGAQGTTRLAFVTGVHFRDTFYVLPEKYNNKAYRTLSGKTFAADTALLIGLPGGNKHRLDQNTHYLSGNNKSMVFQFRLIDETDRRFLIETTKKDGDQEIAPVEGKWVKIQNGVPVISNETPISQAQQNGAEIFDVTNEAIDSAAVSNEAVVASSVKVISEVGAVSILNAAGKKVTISNILGQTVSSAIIPSDNARVALPKGIVVVAIEGEPAVKAVVK
jgi:hypothetical protein